MAQPTDLQAQINTVQWTNGQRQITGAYVLGLFTLLLSILGGMGTWDASGVFTPSLRPGAITAAQGFTSANVATFPSSMSASVQGTGLPGADGTNNNPWWLYNVVTTPLNQNPHALIVQSNENYLGCAVKTNGVVTWQTDQTQCPVQEHTALNVYNISGTKVGGGEDAGRFTMDSYTTGANFQSIGLGAYMINEVANASISWGFITVNYDYDHSGNGPLHGRIGQELDVYGYGPDPLSQRVGLLFNCGYSLGETPGTQGVTHCGTGISLGADGIQGVWDRGLRGSGKFGNFIQLNEADPITAGSGYQYVSKTFSIDWGGNALGNSFTAAGYLSVGANGAGGSLISDASNFYLSSGTGRNLSFRIAGTQVGYFDTNGNMTTGGNMTATGGVVAANLSTTGVLKFGTYTSTTCTNAGYTTIQTIDGTTRKVMICN